MSVKRHQGYKNIRAGIPATEEYRHITPLYVPYVSLPPYLKRKSNKGPKEWYKLENFKGKGLVIIKHYPGYHKDMFHWIIDYEVVDRHGKWLYTGTERSRPWHMSLFGRLRPQDWIIRDKYFVLTVKNRRLFRFTNCFGCCCFLQKMIVENPPFSKTAFIVQEISFYPRWSILDGKGEKIFSLIGPKKFFMKNAINTDFEIIEEQSKRRMGLISQRFGNLLNNEDGEFDPRNCIGVQFPKDSPAYVKGWLVAAAHMLYVTYFEKIFAKKLSKEYTGPEVIAHPDVYDLMFRESSESHSSASS